MRLNLATKFSAIILGVVTLAILSSAVALLSTWHTRRLLRDTVRNDLPSIRTAGELQMAFCEPRGFLASYILEGGNRKWLKELQEKKQMLHDRLAEARVTARTAEEKQRLDRLEKTYREYEAKRDEVVRLYDRRDVEEAKRVLFGDVNDLYQRAFEQVEDFVASTQQDADTQVASVEGQVAGVTGLVAVGVALAVGLGTLLVWLFFYGVLLPLRRMMADARHFSGAEPPAAGEPQDELRAVGDYLRALMSDMADTRSNLERSRNQLLQSEKLASVGRLAASVAHEIRNPLASIRLCFNYMQMKLGESAGLNQEFGIVSEEFSRLDGILKSFLEFSRPPALKPQPHCIRSLLDKTLALVGHQIAEKNLHLLREDAPGLPQVMADPEQLKQVVLNLVKNAAEATPEGGEVCVSTQLDDNGEHSMVVVRVENTGPPIPEDVRQRIFEPFFTTKKEGTGLGLCICARIMAAHGGRLVLESSNDQGTAFAVQIPVAQQAEKEHDQTPQAQCA